MKRETNRSLSVLVSFCLYISSFVSVSALVLMPLHLAAQSSGAVTITFTNTTLKDAISKLEKQTGKHFIYSESLLNLYSKKVNKNYQQEPLSVVLKDILEPASIDFKIQQEKVILLPAQEKRIAEKRPATLDARNVNGKVAAENGELLPGATIALPGSHETFISDNNGDFSIALNDDTATLRISAIGYHALEIKARAGQRLNIVLQATQNNLNEVVVVGYGTQDRKKLIGSVTKIDVTDIKQIPVGSFDAQLQGKAAGVQINSNNGIPGDGIFVRVRGTTSINAGSTPLYIVDGVFINNTSLQTLNSGGKTTSPIADINPTDIESIEVLKDATATSIYGARGANGVIIVTTKRGSFNVRNKVSLNVNQGFAEASRLWKMASGQENAEIYNANWINSGIDNPALNRTYANRPFRPVSEGGRGLPEEQETYDRLHPGYQTANLQNYDLSLQGGTASTRYYLGGSYTKQESVLRPVYFNRASLKLNIDQKVNEQVTVGVSNIISRTYRNQARSGDGGTGNPVLNAMNLARYLPFKNADGSPATYTNYDDQQTLLDNLNQNTVSWRYIGNLFVDATILKGLKFRSSWSLDYNNYDEFIYWNNKLVNGAPPINGSATSAITLNTTWINEQTLSYRSPSGNQHNWGILVGNTLQSNTQKLTSATGVGFPDNSFTQIASAATTSSTQNWTKGTLASFFSRVDYSYAGKYYVEASIRADGASNFGQNKQWGYFPSIGASWRIKQEPFLKDVAGIYDLKLRASTGLTGNQAGISNFAAKGLWTGGASYTDGAGVAPLQLANPDLKWEKTRQTDIGLDLSILRGRLGFVLDVYEKNTSDVLLQLPVQAISGFTSYYSNAGQIRNRGVEFSVNSVNVRGRKFRWETSFNIAYSENKIIKLPTPINVYSRDWIRMEQGHSMYAFWLYKQQYVDPQTGEAVYEDLDKDGKITTADRQLIATAAPKYYGGLSNNLSYGPFDLNFLFTFQGGNKVYTLYRFFGTNGGTRTDRVLYQSEANYWKKPGDITDVPRPSSVGNSYGIENTSRLLEDGSFIRLKTLTLGYTLPAALTAKAGISSARFYVAGTNLLLLTKYPGADPEANVSDVQTVQGLDWGAAPQPRAIQFGVNVTF